LTDPSLADTFHQSALMRDPNDPDTPKFLAGVGALFYTRYKARRCAADLDIAISHFEASVRLTPDFDVDQALRLEALGIAIRNRFDNTGDISDREKARSCFERSLLIRPAADARCG